MTPTSRITIEFKRPYNPYIAPYSTELSWKDKYINLIVCKAIFFVISWLFEKYKLLKASKQIWCQTNIEVLLQQVLDSVLSNDPKNDVSEEKSSEEELDYNDIVKNRMGSHAVFLHKYCSHLCTRPHHFTLLLWPHIFFYSNKSW